LLQSARAVESQQFGILALTLVPSDFVKSAGDVVDRRWVQPGSAEQDTQWIDVIADWLAAHERSLNRSRPATHEWIVNSVAEFGEALDKELGKLRLETGSVTNLLDRMGLPLTSRPKLVDQISNRTFPGFDRRLAELAEVFDEIREWHRAIANGCWKAENRLIEKRKGLGGMGHTRFSQHLDARFLAESALREV
jgi:hypothetical protein